VDERAPDTPDDEGSEDDSQEDVEVADPPADEPDTNTRQTSHYVPI